MKPHSLTLSTSYQRKNKKGVKGEYIITQGKNQELLTEGRRLFILYTYTNK
jgi:hypothetical protein